MEDQRQSAEAEAEDVSRPVMRGALFDGGEVVEIPMPAVSLVQAEEPTDIPERPMADPKKLAEKFGGMPFSGGATNSNSCPPPGSDPPIKWYTTSELKQYANEPINWAVENLFTEHARIIIAGEQKVGKSFFSCALAVSVASGLPFLDKCEIIKQGPVLIIAGEDDRREMARRIDRMCRAMNLEMTDLPIIFGDAHGARLNRPFEIEIIRDRVQETGAALVIADPLARLMEGDENSKECIASVLNPAGKVADDFPCSFAFVHHLGKPNQDTPRSKANRIRGSSDIASWFTCGIFVTGSMDDRELTLEVIQRTSGNIPHKFPVEIEENAEQSAYGRGSIKLVGKFEDAGKRSLHEASEEEVEKVADRVFDLITDCAENGSTKSEIQTRLHITERFCRVALERLILHRGTVVRRKNFERGLDKDRFFSCEFVDLEENEGVPQVARKRPTENNSCKNDQPDLPF